MRTNITHHHQSAFSTFQKIMWFWYMPNVSFQSAYIYYNINNVWVIFLLPLLEAAFLLFSPAYRRVFFLSVGCFFFLWIMLLYDSFLLYPRVFPHHLLYNLLCLEILKIHFQDIHLIHNLLLISHYRL